MTTDRVPLAHRPLTATRAAAAPTPLLAGGNFTWIALAGLALVAGAAAGEEAQVTWRTGHTSGRAAVDLAPPTASPPRLFRLHAVTFSPRGELRFLGRPVPPARDPAVGMTREELNDFFAVSLRAALQQADSPGVSIDPIPNPPAGRGAIEAGDAMPVRFMGGVRETALGNTLFEADRLMKCLGVLRDNLTDQALQCPVADHLDEFTIQASLIAQGKAQVDRVLTRYWFKPQGNGLVASKDRRVIVLLSQPMVDTQNMNGTGANLTNAGTQSPSAVIYANELTRRFDEYAEHYPDFARLRVAMQLVTLAEAIVQEETAPLFRQFDVPRFLAEHPVRRVASPATTPAILASAKVSPMSTVAIVGGVDLTPRGVPGAQNGTATAKEELGKVHAVEFREAPKDQFDDPEYWTRQLSAGEGEVANTEAVALNATPLRRGTAISVRDLDGEIPLGRRYPAVTELGPSLGANWAWEGPHLLLGKLVTWGTAGKHPFRIDLAIPGQPSLAFSEFGTISFNGVKRLVYSDPQAPQVELVVLAGGTGYRLVGYGPAIEFDARGRATQVGDIQIERRADGSITGYRRNGELLREFVYQGEQLREVRDGAGHSERYQYEGSRLVAVEAADLAAVPPAAPAAGLPSVRRSGEPSPAPLPARPVVVTPAAPSPMPAPQRPVRPTAPPEFAARPVIARAEVRPEGLRLHADQGETLDIAGEAATWVDALLRTYPELARPASGADRTLVIRDDANNSAWQWQGRVQAGLARREVRVVSTPAGRDPVEAYQLARRADGLSLVAGGQRRVSVIWEAATLPDSQSATGQEVFAPRALDRGAWVTDRRIVPPAGDVAVVFLATGERGLTMLRERAARGDFRDRIVLLVPLAPGTEQTPWAGQELLRQADSLVQSGAVQVELLLEPLAVGAVQRFLEPLARDTDKAVREKGSLSLPSALESLRRTQETNAGRGHGAWSEFAPFLKEMQENMLKRSDREPRPPHQFPERTTPRLLAARFPRPCLALAA